METLLSQCPVVCRVRGRYEWLVDLFERMVSAEDTIRELAAHLLFLSGGKG